MYVQFNIVMWFRGHIMRSVPVVVTGRASQAGKSKAMNVCPVEHTDVVSWSYNEICAGGSHW